MTAPYSGADDAPLHRLDPTGRFTDRADDYVRFRPDYPAAAIDAVLAGLDLGRIVVADVGAGTGIASRQIADRGARVLAVEPNAGMRRVAAPHPLVDWRAGTAEATGLGAASVDVVVCAQAFHWFRPADALAEFHRILRPGGRLILMWNHRDDHDPLTRGYIAAIHAIQGRHPAERHELEPGTVEAGGGFAPPERLTFAHGQPLDRDGLVGRAASASYAPAAGAAFEELARQLRALHDRYRDASGRVVLRYETIVYRSARREPAANLSGPPRA